LKGKVQEVKSTWPRLPDIGIKEIAERTLRADLHAAASLPTFDEFCKKHRQRLLFGQDA
jgi:hypothetical protein